MPVTLRDVAAKAGVTPTVVSHVLHQRASTVRVSPATAERIRNAAVEMGYRLNIHARNFRTQKTQMIAVVHGMGFARPIFGRESRYFGCLMDGIIESAFSHGYSVTLCPQLLGDNPADAMSDGRFDGLIWYNTIESAQNEAMLERCQVPLVLIHSQPDDYHGKFSTVIADNRQGISIALDYLMELGHRKIAFGIEANFPTRESSARCRWFEGEAAARGLTDAEVVAFDDNLTIPNYLEGERTHTAMIAYNEGLASWILSHAQQLGVRIPDDLSVMGFDSTPFCDELRPRLTSISQPLDSLGQLAVDALIRRIDAPDEPCSHLVLPCGLDVRDSVGKCNPNLTQSIRKS
jgi:LacI family transcriptional regulator